MKRVAIVGTRKPDQPLNRLIPFFKARIPEDALVTSGNAAGIDQISKQWKRNIQYLPWNDYNEDLGFGYKHCVAGGIKIFDDEIFLLFPWLAGTTPSVMRLVRRNFCIVLGRDGTQPVDELYFYAETKNGTVTGGTRYAVELARARGIPVINMKEETKNEL